MKTISRALAVLTSILTTLFLILTLLLFVLRVTLLNPFFLKGLLVYEEAYTRLPGLLVDLFYLDIARSPAGEETVAALERTFGQQPLEDAVAAILPPSWVQQEIEYNIDAFFTWLDSDGPLPDLRLNWEDLKQWGLGEEGREAVRVLLSRLPPCGEGDEFWAEDSIPRCRPPDSELDAILDEIMPVLEENWPETARFRERLAGRPDVLEGLEMVRRVYRSLRGGLWLAGLGTVFFWGVTLLLAARRMDQLLLWGGVPLLAGGGAMLVVMGILFLAAPALADGLGRIPDLPHAIVQYIQPLFLGLLRGAAVRGIVPAGGITLAGLVALIAGLARRHTARP